jgi:hypothetical protein
MTKPTVLNEIQRALGSRSVVWLFLALSSVDMFGSVNVLKDDDSGIVLLVKKLKWVETLKWK